ncbi:MAG TPA: GGDEF domain-containing protein [Oscillatoriaceae cyanobacterium]
MTGMRAPQAPKNALEALARRSLWVVGAYAASLVTLRLVGVPWALGGAIAGLGTTLLFSRTRMRYAGLSPTQLRAVERVSRDMDGVTDPAQLALLVVTALDKALGPTHLYMWLPARERRDLTLAAGLGPDPQCGALSEAWIQEFFETLLHGAHTDLPPGGSEFADWLAARELTLCLPIVSQGRLTGLLTCGGKRDGSAYGPSDRWLLAQMLRQTGLALSYLGLQREEKRRRTRLDNLATLYRDAQQRAITDGLTGLTTHLFFQEQLSQRFHESRRHGGTLSVMLVDVDHFKRINDTFGHPMGDEVLRQVAQAVKNEARTGDTVARYGGEELALVLPLTDLHGALIMAERIRASIEAIEIYDAQTRRLPPVTASLGIAQLQLGDADPTALIERADRALYAAKHGGRNQVVKAS